MRVIKLVALGLLAWPAAEIVAFILVTAVMGFASAVVLILLMSFAGLCIVRHFGGNVVRLRTAAPGGIAGAAWGTAATAPSVGGLLLVIPGFVTSLLGLIILLPTSRRWLLAGCRRLAAAGQRPADPKIVDLTPDEWRSLPGSTLPSPGGPPTN